MSLSKLPDLLKSQICSFLDFNDIKKLEETNKKTRYFLRRYKLDKPNIYELSFSQGVGFVSKDCVSCTVRLEKDSELTEMPRIEYREDRDIHTQKILNCINKFHSIDQLYLSVVSINEEAGWEPVSAKIKNANFSITRINFSKDILINFFKQCKFILLFVENLDPLYINDELFAVLSVNGTTLHFLAIFGAPLEVSVTDATRDILSSKKYLPKDIYLQTLITEITLEGIKKMVEDARTSEIPWINWDFGKLKVDQYDEVRRFVSEEFKDWADAIGKLLYLEQRDTQGYVEYTIHQREKPQKEYNITFALKKPEESIQKENQVDDEPTEEDPMGA